MTLAAAAAAAAALQFMTTVAFLKTINLNRRFNLTDDFLRFLNA